MENHETGEKPIAVYGAITSNLVIATLKFIVAYVTGSSAMISEGIHSVADTGNQLLLLLGLHQSKKPADKTHPFGHGQALYFWSLIVAILLFGIGGGMSIYEGISHLVHPTELRDPRWNYLVLAIAFIVEGISLFIGLRELNRTKKEGESYWSGFRKSKDPSIFVVVAEDSAALMGLIVAFFGILFGHIYNSHYPDAVASIVIGTILAVVAIFLTYESKSLLVGETADTEITEGIKQLILEHPSVEQMRPPLTMHFGPNQILLNLDVQFNADLNTSNLVDIIDSLEVHIREKYPIIRQIFIEIESLRPKKNGG